MENQKAVGNEKVLTLFCFYITRTKKFVALMQFRERAGMEMIGRRLTFRGEFSCYTLYSNLMLVKVKSETPPHLTPLQSNLCPFPIASKL